MDFLINETLKNKSEKITIKVWENKKKQIVISMYCLEKSSTEFFVKCEQLLNESIEVFIIRFFNNLSPVHKKLVYKILITYFNIPTNKAKIDSKIREKELLIESLIILNEGNIY